MRSWWFGIGVVALTLSCGRNTKAPAQSRGPAPSAASPASPASAASPASSAPASIVGSGPVAVRLLEEPSDAGDGGNVARLALRARDGERGSVVLERRSRYSLMELVVVGDVGGGALIVSDAFPADDGATTCAASAERSVRVFALGSEHPHETFRQKIESCEGAPARSNVDWDAASRVLVIDGKPRTVDERGRVTATAATPTPRSLDSGDRAADVDSGASPTIEVSASKNRNRVTTFSFVRRGERATTFTVSYGDTTFGELAELRVVGRADGLVLVEDSYPSRPTSPRSYCGAGTERFLHAFAIDGSRVRETLRLTVESCFASVNAGTPTWDASNRTLQLTWTRLANTERRTYGFARNGDVAHSARILD